MNIGETIQYDNRLKITRVLNDIYLLDDADSGTGYVVIGQDKALVIDTCNGKQDFAAVVRSLTDLPTVVVNTHAHPDHVGGNRYFNKAYLSEAELNAYNKEDHSPCSAEMIHDGDIIDIGGKTLRCIAFPGHTEGGICLLDEADRVLFTGDSVLGRTVWMFMPNSTPISVMKQSLLRLKPYTAHVDMLLTGHSRKPDNPQLIDSLIEACDVILTGAPKDRFGQAEIWGQSLKTCFYIGEDNAQATLVFNEKTAK